MNDVVEVIMVMHYQEHLMIANYVLAQVRVLVFNLMILMEQLFVWNVLKDIVVCILHITYMLHVKYCASVTHQFLVNVSVI